MNLFNLAWKELLHRKVQLITGMIVIVLGVAVIVGIRTFSVASKKAIAINMDNLGANIMVLPKNISVDNYYSADINAALMPESYVEKLMTSTLPGMDNMSPKLSRRILVGDQNVVLTGILPQNEIASKPLWQKGGIKGNSVKASCAAPVGAKPAKYLDPKLKRKGILELSENECLIGQVAAIRLGANVNKSIIIQGHSFKIVGIIPETGTIDDDRIFANLHTVQSLLGTGKNISAIEIMGCCASISDGLLEKMQSVLPTARITTIGQIVSTQIYTNEMMDEIMFFILVIIIVVGIVSIGNYMWSNVNDRKKEIGILRMIGYGKMDIFILLLNKAIFMGGVGAIAGYILGSLITVLLGPQLAEIKVEPIFSLIIPCIVFSITLSIIGSAIPVYLAAKIEPFTNMQEK